MKRALLIVGFLLSFIALPAQIKKPVTASLAGVYTLGANAEKERTGKVTLFAESDSSMLFYLELNNGPEAYNSGHLYGRAWVRDTSGFYSQGYCRLIFQFSKDTLKITSFKRFGDCGFGNGVTAGGSYYHASKKAADFFTDPEGRKIVFKETAPEKYYQR